MPGTVHTSLGAHIVDHGPRYYVDLLSQDLADFTNMNFVRAHGQVSVRAVAVIESNVFLIHHEQTYL